MNKLKRIICVLISLFIVITFTSCDKDGSDESIIDTPSSSQTSKDETKNDIKLISLNKEYFSHYEWYKDSSVMLVRSEYSDVTLDESDSEKYPLLAKRIILSLLLLSNMKTIMNHFRHSFQLLMFR